MFFFNVTATTDIYPLSLHDALPICPRRGAVPARQPRLRGCARRAAPARRGLRLAARPARLPPRARRSEEHTSELQSRQYLVCRLLLEKKKTNNSSRISTLT